MQILQDNDATVLRCMTALEKSFNKNQLLPLRFTIYDNTLLDFIMQHTYFSFNEQFYLQTLGTAIGIQRAQNYDKILWNISKINPLQLREAAPLFLETIHR